MDKTLTKDRKIFSGLIYAELLARSGILTFWDDLQAKSITSYHGLSQKPPAFLPVRSILLGRLLRGSVQVPLTGDAL